MKSILTICLFGSLSVCAQTGDNYPLNGSNPDIRQLKLRTDGLYSTYDTSSMPCGERRMEHYKIFSPIYVLNSSKAIYLYQLGDRGVELSSLAYFKNFKHIENNVGTLHTYQAVIKASLPIQLYVWGMRLKTFTAHFEGTIKNRDTILDWKMVPPYPKAPGKFNNDFKDLLRPKLLYFIENKELAGLDALYQNSVSDKKKKGS